MDRIAAGLLKLLGENWLLLLIVGALVVAFLALRTAGSDVSSLDEVDALLSSGQPTVVEFFSNT